MNVGRWIGDTGFRFIVINVIWYLKIDYFYSSSKQLVETPLNCGIFYFLNLENSCKLQESLVKCKIVW